MARDFTWNGFGICIIRLLEVRGKSAVTNELYNDNQKKDFVGEMDKIKIYKLTAEMIADLHQRLIQTEGIREEHGHHLLFEIGAMLGQIREKYKRQVEMYRQIFNKHNRIATIMSPEDGLEYRPAHYLIVLEFIVAHQLEIEQLVEMVLKVPREDLYVYTPPPQKMIVGSSFPRMLRTRDPRDPRRPNESGEFLSGPAQKAVDQEINRMAQEERLKMRYRAEYNKRHRNNIAKRK